MNEPAIKKQEPETRWIFESKTAFAGAIASVAGALGTFFPNALPWVSQNGPALLLVTGIVNIILRRVTKGHVTFFRNS